MGIKMSSEKRSFCFCKGELVDCIPGRVQDCNVKQARTCILDEQKQINEEIKNTNGFCFVKGELVTCSKGRIQDCNVKQSQKCPIE